MIFFQKKNIDTYKLHISLKSSSIAIQLVKNTGHKKEVLFVERNTLFLDNSQNSKVYIESYFKELSFQLSNCAPKIKQFTQNNSYTIVFILYTPWFTSTIQNLFFKEKVTLDKKFIAQEFKKLIYDAQLQIVEQKITKIQTNGYTVQGYMHTTCSNVQIDIYTSFIPKQISTQLKNLIQTSLNQTTVFFKTSPIIMLENISKFLIKEDNVTFLTVGEEITEVGILENDTLVQFSTFPIGIHDVMRTIQTNIKTYDYGLLHRNEILIKSTQSQTQFDKSIQSWQDSFIQSLSYFKGHVPSRFILISHPKSQEFFNQLLSDILKNNAQMAFSNTRIINFDISPLKDIIIYKTPTGEYELDLTLEALI